MCQLLIPVMMSWRMRIVVLKIINH